MRINDKDLVYTSEEVHTLCVYTKQLYARLNKCAITQKFCTDQVFCVHRSQIVDRFIYGS